MTCLRTLAAVCYSVLLASGHASTTTPTRGRLGGLSVGESCESERDRKRDKEGRPMGFDIAAAVFFLGTGG